MRFLVDNHLPEALARWIAARGCEAVHVRDVGLGAADDGIIWQYALQHGMILVSKDEDFVTRSLMNEQKVVVVWLRCGNTRRRMLLEWMEGIWVEMIARLEAGERMIEVF